MFKLIKSIFALLLVLCLLADRQLAYGMAAAPSLRAVLPPVFSTQAICPATAFDRVPLDTLIRKARLYLNRARRAYAAGDLEQAGEWLDGLFSGDPKNGLPVGLTQIHQNNHDIPEVTKLHEQAVNLQLDIPIIRAAAADIARQDGSIPGYISRIDNHFRRLPAAGLSALLRHVREPMMKQARDLRRAWEQKGNRLLSAKQRSAWNRIEMVITGFDEQAHKFGDSFSFLREIYDFREEILQIGEIISFQQESDEIFQRLIRNPHYNLEDAEDGAETEPEEIETRVMAALISHYHDKDTFRVEDILRARWKGNLAGALAYVDEFLEKAPYPSYLYLPEHLRQAQAFQKFFTWGRPKRTASRAGPFLPAGMIPDTTASLQFETLRLGRKDALRRGDKTLARTLLSQMKEVAGQDVPRDPKEAAPFKKYMSAILDRLDQGNGHEWLLKDMEAFSSTVVAATQQVREELAREFASAHTQVFWGGAWRTNRWVVKIAQWILRRRANRWMEAMVDEFYIGWRNAPFLGLEKSINASEYALNLLYSLHGESNRARVSKGLLGMVPTGAGGSNGNRSYEGRKGWISERFAQRFSHHFRYISMYGLPGIGKGRFVDTFVVKLNRLLPLNRQYAIITTGDILRETLRAGDAFLLNPSLALTSRQRQYVTLAQHISPTDIAAIRAGKLISDTSMVAVLREVLQWPQYRQAYGLFFDGYPRNAQQFRNLDRGVLDAPDRTIRLNLVIVPELAGPDEKTLFALRIKPRHRKGEDWETMSARFEEYHRQSAESDMQMLFASDKAVRYPAFTSEDVAVHDQRTQEESWGELAERFLNRMNPILDRLETKGAAANGGEAPSWNPEEVQALKIIANGATRVVDQFPDRRTRNYSPFINRLRGSLELLVHQLRIFREKRAEAFERRELAPILKAASQAYEACRSLDGWSLEKMNALINQMEDLRADVTELVGETYERRRLPLMPLPPEVIQGMTDRGISRDRALHQSDLWANPLDVYQIRAALCDRLIAEDHLSAHTAAHLAFISLHPSEYLVALRVVVGWLDGLWEPQENPLQTLLTSPLKDLERRIRRAGFSREAAAIWLSPLQPFILEDHALPIPSAYPTEVVESIRQVRDGQARDKAEAAAERALRTHKSAQAFLPVENRAKPPTHSASQAPKSGKPPEKPARFQPAAPARIADTQERANRLLLADIARDALAIKDATKPPLGSVENIRIKLRTFEDQKWIYIVPPMQRRVRALLSLAVYEGRAIGFGDLVPNTPYRISAEWRDDWGLLIVFTSATDTLIYDISDFGRSLDTSEEIRPVVHATLLGRGSTAEKAREESQKFDAQHFKNLSTKAATLKALSLPLIVGAAINPSSATPEDWQRLNNAWETFNRKKHQLPLVAESVDEENEEDSNSIDIVFSPITDRSVIWKHLPAQLTCRVEGRCYPGYGSVIVLINDGGGKRPSTIVPILMGDYRHDAFERRLTENTRKDPRMRTSGIVLGLFTDLDKADAAVREALNKIEMERLIQRYVFLQKMGWKTSKAEADAFKDDLETFVSQKPFILTNDTGEVWLSPQGYRSIGLSDLGPIVSREINKKAIRVQSRVLLHPILTDDGSLFLAIVAENETTLHDFSRYVLDADNGNKAFYLNLVSRYSEPEKAFAAARQYVDRKEKREKNDQTKKAMRELIQAFVDLRVDDKEAVDAFKKRLETFNRLDLVLDQEEKQLLLSITDTKTIQFSSIDPKIPYQVRAEWINGQGLAMVLTAPHERLTYDVRWFRDHAATNPKVPRVAAKLIERQKIEGLRPVQPLGMGTTTPGTLHFKERWEAYRNALASDDVHEIAALTLELWSIIEKEIVPQEGELYLRPMMEDVIDELAANLSGGRTLQHIFKEAKDRHKARFLDAHRGEIFDGQFHRPTHQQIEQLDALFETMAGEIGFYVERFLATGIPLTTDIIVWIIARGNDVHISYNHDHFLQDDGVALGMAAYTDIGEKGWHIDRSGALAHPSGWSFHTDENIPGIGRIMGATLDPQYGPRLTVLPEGKRMTEGYLGPRFEKLLAAMAAAHKNGRASLLKSDGSRSDKPTVVLAESQDSEVRFVEWVRSPEVHKKRFSSLTQKTVEALLMMGKKPVRIILQMGSVGLWQSIELRNRTKDRSVIFAVDPSYRKVSADLEFRNVPDIVIMGAKLSDVPPDIRFSEIRMIAPDPSLLTEMRQHSSEEDNPHVDALGQELAQRLVPNGRLMIVTEVPPNELRIHEALIDNNVAARTRTYKSEGLPTILRTLVAGTPLEHERVTLISTGRVSLGKMPRPASASLVPSEIPAAVPDIQPDPLMTPELALAHEATPISSVEIVSPKHSVLSKLWSGIISLFRHSSIILGVLATVLARHGWSQMSPGIKQGSPPLKTYGYQGLFDFALEGLLLISVGLLLHPRRTAWIARIREKLQPLWNRIQRSMMTPMDAVDVMKLAVMLVLIEKCLGTASRLLDAYSPIISNIVGSASYVVMALGAVRVVLGLIAHFQDFELAPGYDHPLLYRPGEWDKLNLILRGLRDNSLERDEIDEDLYEAAVRFLSFENAIDRVNAGLDMDELGPPLHHLREWTNHHAIDHRQRSPFRLGHLKNGTGLLVHLWRHPAWFLKNREDLESIFGTFSLRVFFWPLLLCQRVGRFQKSSSGPISRSQPSYRAAADPLLFNEHQFPPDVLYVPGAMNRADPLADELDTVAYQLAGIINRLTMDLNDQKAEALINFDSFADHADLVIKEAQRSFKESSVSLEALRAALQEARLAATVKGLDMNRIIRLRHDFNSALFLPFGSSWIQGEMVDGEMKCEVLRPLAWGWTRMSGRPVSFLIYNGGKTVKSAYSPTDRMVLLNAEDIQRTTHTDFRLWSMFAEAKRAGDSSSLSSEGQAFVKAIPNTVLDEIRVEDILRDVLWVHLVEEFGHAEDSYEIDPASEEAAGALIKPGSRLAQKQLPTPGSNALELAAMLRRLMLIRNERSLIVELDTLYTHTQSGVYQAGEEFACELLSEATGVIGTIEDIPALVPLWLEIRLPQWRLLAKKIVEDNFLVHADGGWYPTIAAQGDIVGAIALFEPLVAFFRSLPDFIAHSTARFPEHPEAGDTERAA